MSRGLIYQQGLDLEKLAAKRRFAFVDGLSGLFVPRTRAAAGKVGEKILSSPALANVSEELVGSIRSLKDSQGESGKILLVIDQLDLLLAAGGEQIGAVGLGDMLMGLREVCLQCLRMIATSTDIWLGGSFYCCYAICGLSSCVSSTYAIGEGSRRFLAEFGPPSRFHFRVEAAGYWDSP